MFSWKAMHYAAWLGGEGYGTTYEYMAKARFLVKVKSILGCDGATQLLILGLPQKYGLSLDFLFWVDYLEVENIMVFDTRDDLLVDFMECRQYLIDEGLIKNIPIKDIRDWDHLDEMDLSSCIVVSCESFQAFDEDEKVLAAKTYNRAKYGFCFVPNDYNEAHRKITHLPTIKENNLNKYFTNILTDCYLDCPPVPSGFELPSSGRDKTNLSFGWKDKFFYFILDVWLNIDVGFLSRLMFYRQYAHLYGVAM